MAAWVTGDQGPAQQVKDALEGMFCWNLKSWSKTAVIRFHTVANSRFLSFRIAIICVPLDF